MAGGINDPLSVSRHEHGVVRVFAINGEPNEVKAWSLESARAERLAEIALGVETLDWSHVEVVDAEAVRALGLSTYLTDGLGLGEEAVRADRARLDALDGHVLIVASRAFGGADLTLDPGPQITLIGAYREPQPTPSFERLEADSAKGVLSGGGSPDAGRSGGRNPWLIATLAVIAVLLLALLFSGRG